jgi:hypothetical protein
LWDACISHRKRLVDCILNVQIAHNNVFPVPMHTIFHFTVQRITRYATYFTPHCLTMSCWQKEIVALQVHMHSEFIHHHQSAKQRHFWSSPCRVRTMLTAFFLLVSFLNDCCGSLSLFYHSVLCQSVSSTKMVQ